MFETRITKMLGIKHPILVGTMVHISCAEMVAAASNAGALGILASTNYPTREQFRVELQRLRDDGQALCRYLDILVSEGVKIVETSGHRAPEELVKEIKGAGILLIHKCVGVRYALKAQSIGADAVTVVGYENGGATGTLDITTLCLVPRVVDALSVPVIGGGGVADGRGLFALLALGAQGVIMGTAFLVSEECPIHPRLKQALIAATELDTMVVMRSTGNSHRVWVNEAARKVAELDSQGAGLEEIVQAASGGKAKRMYQQGDVNAGIMSCGQGVGLVGKVRPMKDIIEEIMHQADEVRHRLVAR